MTVIGNVQQEETFLTFLPFDHICDPGPPNVGVTFCALNVPGSNTIAKVSDLLSSMVAVTRQSGAMIDEQG